MQLGKCQTEHFKSYALEHMIISDQLKIKTNVISNIIKLASLLLSTAKNS